MPPPETFLADVMLGRLARYLVMGGYDCLYHDELEDDIIVRLHRETGRHVLTRDAGLAERLPDAGVLKISSDELSEQLRQLRNRWSIQFRRGQFFTRCPACSRYLRILPANQFSEQLPPQTRTWVEKILYCRGCDQIYWQGSHYEDVINRFESWGLLEKP